jgi:hypothetical protein
MGSLKSPEIWNSLPFFVTSDVSPALGCQSAELWCERRECCFTCVKPIYLIFGNS